MKHRKMSLVLIVAMLFTMMFNTMAFAEEGFEGDAAQVQDFILNHAEAESVMSETFLANIEAWNGGGLWIDTDENGSVSNAEAETAIWFMQGMNLTKAYLVTSSTSYQITLLDEAKEQEVYNTESVNADVEVKTQTEPANESAITKVSDDNQVQELELTEKVDFINIKEELEKHLDVRSKAYINESYMGYRHLAYPTIESEVTSDEYIAYADSYSPDYLVLKEEYQRAPTLDVVLKSFPIESYKDIDFTGLVVVDKQEVDRDGIDQLSNDDVTEAVISIDENTDVKKAIEEVVGNTNTSSNIDFNEGSHVVIDAIEKVIENEKAKQNQLKDIITILDEVTQTDEKPVRVDNLNEAIRAIDEVQKDSSNQVEEEMMILDEMLNQPEVLKVIQDNGDETSIRLDDVRNILSEVLDADSNEDIDLMKQELDDIINELELDIQILEEMKEVTDEILSLDNVQDGFEALEKSLNDSEGDINKTADTEVEEATNTDEEPYRWTLTISLLGAALLAAGLIFAGIAIKKSRKKGE